MQHIEIRHHHHTAKIIYSGEYADLKHCALAAIESGASLRGANLRGAFGAQERTGGPL